MKNHLISLVFFSISFFALIGCEDNSVNNPVSTDSVNKTDPNGENTVRQSIVLDHKLIDPIDVSKYYLLNGRIDYYQQMELVQNPIPAAPSYEVGLVISVNAKMKEMLINNNEPETWNIRLESNDRFILSESSSYTLIKAYPLDEVSDLYELVCTFEITTDGMKLVDIVLRSPVV